MKLLNYNLENPIDFEQSAVWTLVCESPHQFCLLTENMHKQADGQDGGWRLADAGKATFAKSVVYVADYFRIDVNDKKAVNLLQEKLKELAFDEAHSAATHEIIAALDRYVKLLSLDIDVPVTVGNVDFSQIGKIISIALLDDSCNILERLVDFATLLSRLTPAKLLVCVNLRSYLDNNELEQFFLHCMQCDINLLCIESHLRGVVANEKVLVCDGDLCEFFLRETVDTE